MLTLKISIFIFATIIIAAISRKSLGNFRSHGFYRFFAWELILILFLLNVGFWFRNPFSWNQIISWIFLVGSAFCVIEGTRLLHARGKSDALRRDESLYTFEKTTALVSQGIYRYIRHPLYASLLFLAWGIFFKAPSPVGFLLGSGAGLVLTLTAKIEEKENRDYFGDEYIAYMQKTKMFIPFIW